MSSGPWGQVKAPDEAPRRFAHSTRFDIKLVFGVVSAAEADAMISGYVLRNDWSARDLKTWEY